MGILFIDSITIKVHRDGLDVLEKMRDQFLGKSVADKGSKVQVTMSSKDLICVYVSGVQAQYDIKKIRDALKEKEYLQRYQIREIGELIIDLIRLFINGTIRQIMYSASSRKIEAQL